MHVPRGDADRSTDRFRRCPVVAGEQHRPQPEGAQGGDTRRAVGLHRVGQRDGAQHLTGGDDLDHGRNEVARPGRGAPDGDVDAFDDTVCSDARLVAEVLDRDDLDADTTGVGNDRPSDRVLAGRFDGGRQPHHPDRFVRSEGPHGGNLHHTGGDGAGLVEHDGVDPAGALEHFGSLDQDAELRAAPGAHQQRGGRGQSERARTGDDQHRHGRTHRVLEAAGAAEPHAQRGDRERHHHGDEDGGDTVGESLDGCLAALSLFDEASHLRKGRVGADAGGADHEPPVGVDRRSGDGIARADVARQALARHEGGVDRRPARIDHAVGGDALAGAHHEPVADRE